MRRVRIIIALLVLIINGMTLSYAQEKASNPLYQPEQPSQKEGKTYFAKAKVINKHDVYSSIEKDVNNKTFTEGYPVGKNIGTVQPGETIELLKVFENGTESKYTYKIKTARGTTGYILPQGFNITEVVGDKGAILSVHLSRPYEFEGDVQAVDELIGKYEKFIQDYTGSEFIPEALVNIIGLHLYTLQTQVNKRERMDKILNLLNKLSVEAKNSNKYKTALHELMNYVTEHQNELCAEKADYKIYSEAFRLQQALSDLVPSSLSLGRNEIN